MLISVVVGVSNMFVYCFFGRLATESYAKMANSIYEANWPNLPVNLQKYFILMIGNAQRSIFYHGFFATLNLETFTKVRHKLKSNKLKLNKLKPKNADFLSNFFVFNDFFFLSFVIVIENSIHVLHAV